VNLGALFSANAKFFAEVFSSVYESASHAFTLDFNLSPQHPAPGFAHRITIDTGEASVVP
jgi:hypothetical protein